MLLCGSVYHGNLVNTLLITGSAGQDHLKSSLNQAPAKPGCKGINIFKITNLICRIITILETLLPVEFQHEISNISILKYEPGRQCELIPGYNETACLNDPAITGSGPKPLLPDPAEKLEKSFFSTSISKTACLPAKPLKAKEVLLAFLNRITSEHFLHECMSPMKKMGGFSKHKNTLSRDDVVV